jgi:hypothetical protein
MDEFKEVLSKGDATVVNKLMTPKKNVCTLLVHLFWWLDRIAIVRNEH